MKRIIHLKKEIEKNLKALEQDIKKLKIIEQAAKESTEALKF